MPPSRPHAVASANKNCTGDYRYASAQTYGEKVGRSGAVSNADNTDKRRMDDNNNDGKMADRHVMRAPPRGKKDAVEVVGADSTASGVTSTAAGAGALWDKTRSF